RDQPAADRSLPDGTARRAKRPSGSDAHPPAAGGRYPGRTGVEQYPEPVHADRHGRPRPPDVRRRGRCPHGHAGPDARARRDRHDPRSTRPQSSRLRLCRRVSGRSGRLGLRPAGRDRDGPAAAAPGREGGPRQRGARASHGRALALAHRLAAKIAHIDGTTLPVGTLDITLYRDDLGMRGTPVIRGTDIPFSIKDKTVILVDDVLFTGRTIRAALDAIVDLGRPTAIQ